MMITTCAACHLLLIGCDFLDSGRYVKIQPPMQPRSAAAPTSASAGGAAGGGGGSAVAAPIRPAGCRTVFIKNLPYDVTEEAIREAFMVCGPITTVRLAVWGHTGQLKGFGYIDFKREDSAEIAGIACCLLF